MRPLTSCISCAALPLSRNCSATAARSTSAKSPVARQPTSSPSAAAFAGSIGTTANESVTVIQKAIDDYLKGQAVAAIEVASEIELDVPQFVSGVAEETLKVLISASVLNCR